VVRRAAAAEASGHLEARAHLGGAEQDVVVLAEAPRAFVLDGLPGAKQLDGAVGKVELPPDVEARVDPLLGHHAGDLRHGRVQRALLVDDGLPAVRLRGTLARAGEGGVTPAAVTPRGLEAAISFSSTATRSVGSAFLR
jgi:hypothetical protein